MISNENSAPYGRWPEPSQRPTTRPFNQSSDWHPGAKPPVREDFLKSGEVQIERKRFVFALKENPRGRLLRITEDVGGRYNSIIIPATGLHEFKRLVDEMVGAMAGLPPEKKPPESA